MTGKKKISSKSETDSPADKSTVKKKDTQLGRFFNTQELFKINENANQYKIAQLETTVAKLIHENMILKGQIHSFKCADQQREYEKRQGIEAGAREVRQSFMKMMEKKHKLDPGWGFNPDSGEIVQGE